MNRCLSYIFVVMIFLTWDDLKKMRCLLRQFTPHGEKLFIVVIFSLKKVYESWREYWYLHTSKVGRTYLCWFCPCDFGSKGCSYLSWTFMKTYNQLLKHTIFKIQAQNYAHWTVTCSATGVCWLPGMNLQRMHYFRIGSIWYITWLFVFQCTSMEVSLLWSFYWAPNHMSFLSGCFHDSSKVGIPSQFQVTHPFCYW